ncbi:MAG: prolyl oligopeptidase family serine peptidase [Clostridia bacterium]|nr:prolyl oligopeptidase family serine peptidase [Clostridia bacterium]
MEIARYKELDYVLRYPTDFSDKNKYPLVIFLHGAGTRGRNPDVLRNNSFFKETTELLSGALSVAPQCYAESWFDIFEQLQDFIEAMIAPGYVDKSRVYLIGNSMGGYGTWQMGISRPELFAAIVPICGGGMYWDAHRLKKTAVWAFHGDADTTVLCEESQKMVNAIHRKGGNARLTVYEGVGHDSWTQTFRSEEMWTWLFEQTNPRFTSETPQTVSPSPFDNASKFG